MPTLTGIKYYDEKVFPKIEKRKRTFNLIGGVFWTFWYAYKGMWIKWLQWALISCVVFFISFFELKVPDTYQIRAIWGIQIIVGLIIGCFANVEYYKHVYKHKPVRSRRGLIFGILGLLVYPLLLWFLLDLTLKMLCIYYGQCY
jgi:hypothetical protein